MGEPRSDIRYPVVLPALCFAADRPEFHAVTVHVSQAGILLRSSVIPPVDSRLMCRIRDVGEIDAEVARTSACDFAIRVTGQTPTPGSVARKLIELGKRQATGPQTVRVERRIVPLRTLVEVRLDGDVTIPAQIINLSASGVALLIDGPLEIGQTITVGHQRATIVRRIEGGIGAAFVTPLDAATVDERLEI